MTERREAIRELQQRLRRIQKISGEATAIIPDGEFSLDTELLVEKLQRNQGYEVTGVVDYTTWETVKKTEGELSLKAGQPVQTAPIKNDDLPLKRGMSNGYTQTLKLMLNRVAESYGNFPLIAEDTFGEETAEAVRLWRRVASLEEGEEADREVWDSLSAFYLTHK